MLNRNQQRWGRARVLSSRRMTSGSGINWSSPPPKATPRRSSMGGNNNNHHTHNSLSQLKENDDAFSGCKSIGEWAFNNCINLREVVFNEGLQKIGSYAFLGCRSLSSITLPSTVTEVNNHAFHNCKQLKEVMFNEGLQKIGGGAFCLCTSLSNIKLPSTVVEIDGDAFRFCISLVEVAFHSVPRKIGKNAFYNCTSLGIFMFPTISSRLYTLIQTGHWGEIENEVNEVRGVVERSGSELLFVSSEAMGEGRNWNRVREDLDKIIRLISYYELKEGTSTFELALWKFKLDQVDGANPIPRKKCRMDAPGPVKDIILQYLKQSRTGKCLAQKEELRRYES